MICERISWGIIQLNSVVLRDLFDTKIIKDLLHLPQ